MSKFILRAAWFLCPIIALHLFTFKYYVTDKADLLKIGYIIDLYPHYHDLFEKEYQNKIRYTEISEQPEEKTYTVLTIGDSFSELEGCGYKNYLAQNNGITLLHINRTLSNNQIQTLYSLLNGDLFEQYHFKFVILQNIERHFIDNTEYVDPNKQLSCGEMMELYKIKHTPTDDSYKFPSDRVLKFPYYTVQYYLQKSFLFNEKVYKAPLCCRLFSVDSKELLFYEKDLRAVVKNNKLENVHQLNNILNDLNDRLNKKGIKLIVLPAPDKYDAYYDYIVDKHLFPRPLFFEHFRTVSKKYICIDSKTILCEAIRHKKDIYYYDDTHWSPWAARFVADAIHQQIVLHQETPSQDLQK